MNVRIVGLCGMNRYSWKWNLADLKQDKDVTVFSTFSCGGGSTMGYKRAGFKVLGNVEIDPRINDIYITNHKPKYNYCEDLRLFNQRDDLPEELYNLDILDGSPPCTSFSTSGVRDRDWGKEKKFREGQVTQTLDDLFFVFLDTVEKLQPKIVVAENVPGIVTGKAKGYVKIVIDRFKAAGYDLQIFALNGAHMDVPQARHRIFFIANRCGFKPLKMNFEYDTIPFKDVRDEEGIELKDGMMKKLLEYAKEEDRKLSYVSQRLTGKKSYYSAVFIHDKQVAPTITSSGVYIRMCDKTRLTDNDFRRVQSFPEDYNFKKQSAQYVCGMSVPPNMMANVATEIYEQWLK